MFPHLLMRHVSAFYVEAIDRLGFFVSISILMLTSAMASTPLHHRADQEASITNRWVTVVDGTHIATRLSHSDIQIIVAQQDGSRINLSADNIRGSVSIQCGESRKWYRYGLRTTAQGCLTAPLSFPVAPGEFIQLRVQIAGIPEARTLLSYRESGIVAPSREQVQREAIDRQRFCPISGHLLHLLSDPIEAKLNGKIVYCCSVECVAELESVSSEMLVSFPRVSTGDFSEADEELIRLQRSCPVMEMPLGSMGNPVKVMVGRQPVFLCCKGCLVKVKKNPVHYAKQSVGEGSDQLLQRLASSSQVEQVLLEDASEKLPSGVYKVGVEDQRLIAEQKICPVMEEPLDAMGGPYKVNLNGKMIYICCPGCASSLRREPEEYVGFLNDRGITLPIFR